MQRTSRQQSGNAFADYGDSNGAYTAFGYDGKGEVTSAYEYLGASADSTKKLQDRQHEYAYDNIGNRQWSNRTGNSALRDNYTANLLNQYASKENNTVVVSGTADATARVAISRQTSAAARQGNYWSQTFTGYNSSAPWYAALSVYTGKPGAGSGGTDLVRTDVRIAQIAAALQTFQYDLDGNIQTDGIWNYGWDAENRLISMTTTTTAASAGFPNRAIQFRYDYLGRRVQKLVYDAGTNQLILGRRFLYDGWNLVGEFVDTGATAIGGLVRSYTWGLDIARTFADAGGVGALVEIVDYSSRKAFLPTYDGNGNVISLLNADTGAYAATYEYSPFGETLRADVIDPVVATQPYRFSTQYLDNESGFYAYVHRYYVPTCGRFISRDPIAEVGGLNLYTICTNDTTNRFDVLGHLPTTIINGKIYDIISIPAVLFDPKAFAVNYPNGYWGWDPTFTLYYNGTSGFGASISPISSYVYIAVPSQTNLSTPATTVSKSSPNSPAYSEAPIPNSPNHLTWGSIKTNQAFGNIVTNLLNKSTLPNGIEMWYNNTMRGTSTLGEANGDDATATFLSINSVYYNVNGADNISSWVTAENILPQYASNWFDGYILLYHGSDEGPTIGEKLVDERLISDMSKTLSLSGDRFIMFAECSAFSNQNIIDEYSAYAKRYNITFIGANMNVAASHTYNSFTLTDPSKWKYLGITDSQAAGFNWVIISPTGVHRREADGTPMQGIDPHEGDGSLGRSP